ncbi:MAG: hypothetical protein FWB97_09010 [Oscillospiraceae bacterium]|nr:hypothetical protein [Oscillospiraceae bacterium]
MKKASTTSTAQLKSAPTDFAPTQEQIDALARRLMPEIKKFFADTQVQQEFANWQKKQAAAD